MNDQYSLGKIRRLKIKLTIAIGLFILVIVSGYFIFSPLLLRQKILALSLNYNKSAVFPNNDLTVDDWNNLPNDFIDKSGDTIGGTLDMGGNRIINTVHPPTINSDAATKQYVDDNSGFYGGAAQDQSGAPLRYVCGETPHTCPGNPTNWIQYSANTVYVDIDTSAAGFGSTPWYFTSLGGSLSHYLSRGATSIYSSTPTGFRVYVTYINGNITADTAKCVYTWYINWCGIGQ